MIEDLYLELGYDMKEGIATIIDTNIKKNCIDDFLEDWLSCQGGSKDERAPNKQRHYHIRISADLSDDTFYTKSDTGNEGLTVGIIWGSFGKLKFPEESAQIQPVETSHQR